MTLGELMQLVMRMQVQARQLSEAFAAYDGWRDDVPGDNVNYCARIADNIAWDLVGIRDSLREELKAASQASASEDGEGIAPASQGETGDTGEPIGE